ncbi:sulfite exporter TauE/SafE family protein [soil metagenome]
MAGNVGLSPRSWQAYDAAVTGFDAQPWLALLTLFLVGAISAAINVVAGGGSFLALPAMILLGLPPTVANGTNRVAILAQNVAAVWGFQRHRLIRWEGLAWAALPAIAGAAVGTWVAIQIGDVAFRRALAVIMIAVALWSLWYPPEPSRSGAAPQQGTRPDRGRLEGPGLFLAFLACGIYGGFVQAGVGFLLLAATTQAGLDLVRGNALKVLIVLLFTPLSLALFAAGDKVAWGMGAALAAGSVLGALAGVRLTVLKGHAWVRRFVTVTVIAFAVLMWFGP